MAHSEDKQKQSDQKEKKGIKKPVAAGISICLAAILVISAFVWWIPAAGSEEAEEEPSESAAETVSVSADPAPSVSDRRAAEPAVEETTAASETPPWVNAEFSKAVLIGSSTTEGLYIYDLLDGASYLYGTGLTVETVMTQPMSGGNIPVIEELSGQDYNQVILGFGLNEAGWPRDDVFLQYYAAVIARVREYLPGAVIYIQSVLPVGQERSGRNRFGVNQDRINQINDMLRDFAAQQGVRFLDVSTEMKGPDGYLPADAAVDGVHPTREAAVKWMQIMKRKMEEILNEGNGATPPPDVAAAQAAATAAAQADEAARRAAAEQAAAEQAAAEQAVAEQAAAEQAAAEQAAADQATVPTA